MPQRITKPGSYFLRRVRAKMYKQRFFVVTVVNALSGDVILEAHCRSQFKMKGDSWGPMVHCLKSCIQEESGLNLWEFSLMLMDGRLLSDRMRVCCPPMTMLRQHNRKLTLKMVRHFVDVRHLTARNFPDVWLACPISTFMDIAGQLFSAMGEVAEIVDVSQQWVRDDDRDGERTIEVRYLHATSGIKAVAALNGFSLAEFAPPPKDRFVCEVTGSPVLIESCDCVNWKCTDCWRLFWRTKLER